MRGCWRFGSVPERLAPNDLICVRGTWGMVVNLFAILGCEVMAEHGYLEEVWDAGIADLAQAEPWPLVDILDDGRVVARRVPRVYLSACDK